MKIWLVSASSRARESGHFLGPGVLTIELLLVFIPDATVVEPAIGEKSRRRRGSPSSSSPPEEGAKGVSDSVEPETSVSWSLISSSSMAMRYEKGMVGSKRVTMLSRALRNVIDTGTRSAEA